MDDEVKPVTGNRARAALLAQELREVADVIEQNHWLTDCPDPYFAALELLDSQDMAEFDDLDALD